MRVEHVMIDIDGVGFNAHAVASQGEEGFVKNAIRQRQFPSDTVATQTAKAKKVYELCVAECKEKGIEFEILPMKPTKAEKAAAEAKAAKKAEPVAAAGEDKTKK